MSRRFNTEGPCEADQHSLLSPLRRLPTVRSLIATRSYFAIHAPRQSGKRTALKILAHDLTTEGAYAALHLTCEGAGPPSDPAAAEARIALNIRNRAETILLPELRPPSESVTAEGAGALYDFLRRWATACPRPLVLFFDEIGTLRDEALVSVLRELRAGFDERLRRFPSSVVL